MTLLDLWKSEHLMNPAFMISEIASELGLTVASSQGIISFAGTSDNPLAAELIGKTFDYNFEEVIKFVAPVVQTPVKPVVVKVDPVPVNVNDTIKDS